LLLALRCTRQRLWYSLSLVNVYLDLVLWCIHYTYFKSNRHHWNSSTILT